MIILSALAGLYRSGHEEFTTGNPDENKSISNTIFTAVIVYAVRAPAREPIRHLHTEMKHILC
jgi:hypothetical protein